MRDEDKHGERARRYTKDKGKTGAVRVEVGSHLDTILVPLLEYH
jgi:hypothetical protein